MTSWAVDLKTIGAIYPFQGTEVLLAIVCLAFVVIWFVMQTRHENAEIDADMKADKRGDDARVLIDNY
jgi:hypothetical protein